MQKGKVSEITYKRSVMKKITCKNEGIRPGVDAAEMKLEDVTVVMSSNCVLEWFTGCEEYYLQKSINGIYEKGGVPLYVQLEINIPMEYEEKLLGKIVKNFNDAAGKKSLAVCQCKVYAGEFTNPVVHVTVIGNTGSNMSRNKIKPGMDVVMTGSIAIGGTAIIAEKYKDRLSEKFSGSFVRDCCDLKDYLSVERESNISMNNGAIAMHSVSEGGVFSAIWELASSVDLGITVRIPDIPVWQETIEVSEVFDINPYLLDGTGSMLIVSPEGQKIVESLQNEGIVAAVIGVITDSKDRIAVNGEEIRYLEPPRGDEIYKIL